MLNPTYEKWQCIVDNEIIDIVGVSRDDILIAEIATSNKQPTTDPQTSQQEKTAEYFKWTDSATKLFLNIYKDKKLQVASRKIKTLRLMWKAITTEMNEMGYNVTPVQVENKFKTMERAYKLMIANNKKTGRAKKSCSFERYMLFTIHIITIYCLQNKR